MHPTHPFPDDFMFQLAKAGYNTLLTCQIGASKTRRRHVIERLDPSRVRGEKRPSFTGPKYGRAILLNSQYNIGVSKMMGRHDGLNAREATMLGQGVYTVAEVSRLTELHPNRVRSWFKQRSDGSGYGPVFESDYQPIDGDYAVSFYDLIDVLVAGTFRDQFNVPMQVVRRAHSLLQEQLDTKHPFCHSDLYTDGRSIFLHAADELDEEILSEVVSRQQFFLHIKEKLHHIDYNEMTKLARRWKIAKGVVIDPLVSMGKPTVENSGVTTYVIANQYEANVRDGVLVADLYGISQSDVANAVAFERWYRRRYAA